MLNIFNRFHFVIFFGCTLQFAFSDEEVLPDFVKDRPFSESFSSYSVKKLNKLLEKIDTNRDLQITKEELIDWMVKLSLNDLDKRARLDINYYDQDKDNRIAWTEMLRSTYGYDEEGVEKISHSKDPIDKEHYELIEEDRAKFQAADSDSDGFLTHTEYKDLLNPSDNTKLMKLAVDKIMTKNDVDKDSQLNEHEFKIYFYITDQLTQTQQKDFEHIFYKYDFNKDKKMSVDEFEKWYAPDIKVAANIEADALIAKTDTNNDQILTFDEVLSKLDDWKVSHATNYGEHVKDEL